MAVTVSLGAFGVKAAAAGNGLFIGNSLFWGALFFVFDMIQEHKNWIGAAVLLVFAISICVMYVLYNHRLHPADELTPNY